MKLDQKEKHHVINLLRILKGASFDRFKAIDAFVYVETYAWVENLLKEELSPVASAAPLEDPLKKTIKTEGKKKNAP